MIKIRPSSHPLCAPCSGLPHSFDRPVVKAAGTSEGVPEGRATGPQAKTEESLKAVTFLITGTYRP